jgi:hypothetical protein
MSGLTASQQSIFNQAADRWEQVITGDLPNATYRGQTVDDLLINASAIAIDGVNGVLGQAGADAFRSGSRLPYHGIMQFDTADLANMERNGTLMSVVMHEMGHVLGIGTIWSSLGLLSGAGTSNPTFRGAQATAAYNQIFGTSASGVPVENTGGSGTRDAHWRENIFGSELMTGWVGPGTSLPLSRVTVASLADIGYTVNYAMANTFVPTSTMLTRARQASSSLSSSRLFGIVGAQAELNTNIVVDWRGVSSSHAEGNSLRSLATATLSNELHAGELNERLVDAVMTQSWRRPCEASIDNFVRADDADDVDVSSAWDELETARLSWALLSLG